MPFFRFLRWIFKAFQQEFKHITQATCGMGCIINFILIVIHYPGPYFVHILMITANKILIAVIETHIHAKVIFIHIKMAVFNRKIFRPNPKFSRATKISCRRNKVWVFPSNPESHKPPHRETGNSPVIPVSNCIVTGIYIFNKFRKIYRELAISFYRTNIVWAQIVFIFRIPVIAVRLNYNNIMVFNKISNIISVVVSPFINPF